MRNIVISVLVIGLLSLLPFSPRVAPSSRFGAGVDLTRPG
jgi:hypothetical protein